MCQQVASLVLLTGLLVIVAVAMAWNLEGSTPATPLPSTIPAQTPWIDSASTGTSWRKTLESPIMQAIIATACAVAPNFKETFTEKE